MGPLGALVGTVLAVALVAAVWQHGVAIGHADKLTRLVDYERGEKASCLSGLAWRERQIERGRQEKTRKVVERAAAQQAALP